MEEFVYVFTSLVNCFLQALQFCMLIRAVLSWFPLDDSNKWTHTWKAAKDQNDPSKWHVREVISEDVKKNFSITKTEIYDEATYTKSINIKNVFDRKQLEIKISDVAAIEGFNAFAQNNSSMPSRASSSFAAYSCWSRIPSYDAGSSHFRCYALCGKTDRLHRDCSCGT